MTILLFVIVIFLGNSIFFLYKAFKKKNVQYDKIRRNFLMLYDWINLQSECPSESVLASILQKKGYNKIIIYGWGYLGNLLYRELRHTKIEIKGILGRICDDNVYNIPSYSLQSELPEVDAVIITVLYDAEVIRNDVEKILKCPVVSLEELV